MWSLGATRLNVRATTPQALRRLIRIPGPQAGVRPGLVQKSSSAQRHRNWRAIANKRGAWREDLAAVV